jgi:hypothetical protein
MRRRRRTDKRAATTWIADPGLTAALISLGTQSNEVRNPTSAGAKADNEKMTESLDEEAIDISLEEE